MSKIALQGVTDQSKSKTERIASPGVELGVNYCGQTASIDAPSKRP